MKKTIHKGDFNQVAKYIVDLSTGQNQPEKLPLIEKKLIPKKAEKTNSKKR